MKTKPKHVALALILAGIATAIEPDTPTVEHPEARQAVQTRIVARLQSSFPPFSRMAPPQPSSQFQRPMLVDKEERLPFKVVDGRGKSIMLAGYVRLSDQRIFIYDTEKQTYTDAALDPRFAPPADKAKTDKPT
ncbi:hypothetical protein HAHE_09660 [Haloferula helveola]|uniref:Uncharacterized protein n=1 Tax=Haloferula helveola TaxID=490095 RepID=A0ABN6H0S1_9BACT|nr:hypothetical protein HAHE_09660 [Haloferula helveola]